MTILIFKRPSCETLRLSICVALKNSSISQKASFINRLWRVFFLLKLNKQARYGYKKLCTLTISKTQIKSKFRIHHSSNRKWKLHSAITYNYYRWIDVLDTLIEPIFFGVFILIMHICIYLCFLFNFSAGHLLNRLSYTGRNMYLSWVFNGDWLKICYFLKYELTERSKWTLTFKFADPRGQATVDTLYMYMYITRYQSFSRLSFGIYICMILVLSCTHKWFNLILTTQIIMVSR